MSVRLVPCPICEGKLSSNAVHCPYCGGQHPLATPGSFSSALTKAEIEKINTLKKEAGTLEAIKYLRSLTDCGLPEAKTYTEGLKWGIKREEQH